MQAPSKHFQYFPTWTKDEILPSLGKERLNTPYSMMQIYQIMKMWENVINKILPPVMHFFSGRKKMVHLCFNLIG